MKTKQYKYGHSDSQHTLQSSRSIETYGQFLRLYLKSGMSVLDCGCGPGTMTIDFAKLVSPASVIGIDLTQKVLETARKNASESRVDNVSFQQADIFNLPFEDNTFDFVYAQTVLIHINNPIAAIKEMRRVTKPGGIVAAKDPYFSGWMSYPYNKLIEEYLPLHILPIQEEGGDPDIGIKLDLLFHEAGFEQTKMQTSCFNPDLRSVANHFVNQIFTYPSNIKLLEESKITREKLQTYQKAWQEFADIPGAYHGLVYGEIIAWK